MNGNWDPWGQKPVHYVALWKSVVNAVRAIPGAAKKVAFLWAPNINPPIEGYPFGGLGDAPFTSAARTSSVAIDPTEFAALDTNGDGIFDNGDDPYSPYFPGPEYVDWVGAS
ncbi:hypothetical protein BDK51DRAFT_6501, partial [Blyttiomyces helicus]